jgi:cytochrome c peroxidase
MNKDEFNTEIHQFSNKILTDTTYTKMVIDVFGHVPSKNTEVIRAISSYISSLKGMNSRFDKNIKGEEDNFTASEKNGVNLFMGKALCATCHFMPLTNGTVPPFYSESEREVIGVPKTNKNKELDTDLGFYWKYNQLLHKGMFKTPTIRNIEETAPYMHNGVYNSLEEVMNFYNIRRRGWLRF